MAALHGYSCRSDCCYAAHNALRSDGVHERRTHHNRYPSHDNDDHIGGAERLLPSDNRRGGLARGCGVSEDVTDRHSLSVASACGRLGLGWMRTREFLEYCRVL